MNSDIAETAVEEILSEEWEECSAIRVVEHYGTCLRFRKEGRYETVHCDIKSTDEKDTTYYIGSFWQPKTKMSISKEQFFRIEEYVKSKKIKRETT